MRSKWRLQISTEHVDRGWTQVITEYQDEVRFARIREVVARQHIIGAQRSGVCDTGRARPTKAIGEGVAQVEVTGMQEEGV